MAEIVILIKEDDVATMASTLVSSCLGKSIEIAKTPRDFRKLGANAELSLIDIHYVDKKLLSDLESTGLRLVLLSPLGTRPGLSEHSRNFPLWHSPLPTSESIGLFLDNLKAILKTIGNIQYKDLVLYVRRRVLQCKNTGKEVLLTQSENLLLYEFLSQPGELLTHDQLMEVLGGRQKDRSSVRHQVKSINGKIKEIGELNHRVDNVRGEGYRLSR